MPDPRTDRSRRRLHDALVALILERGWDRVTVRAVCQRARVGRSTFYLHFADKEDCLVGGLEHVRDDLTRHSRVSDDRTGSGQLMRIRGEPFAFVHGLIAHADASRRLFRAVIGKRSGLAVQRRFREIVLELMTASLGAKASPQLARFLSGALVEMLFGWVDGKDASRAADVEREFVRLASRVAGHR